MFEAEKIDRMSVKKIRDSITNGVNDKTLNELSDRYEELDRYMNSFLNKIRTFDAT